MRESVRDGGTSPATTLKRLMIDLREILPTGRSLSDDIWPRRHRGILVLLWLHALGIVCFGLVVGSGPVHSLLDGALVVAFALVASWTRIPRRWRAALASLGLITTSAMLVHVSGGQIEFHFHFFVMIAVITLYQDWLPFLGALGYVIAHHGLLGVLAPTSVYNHPAAWANPWGWAALHGAFVLAASVANIVAWRLNEHTALHDPLTGLPNRALFYDRVAHALAHRDRRAAPFAVLFLDLDHFKAVNDRLGHAAGDALLRAVAGRLGASLRRADMLARLGGDEFAILLGDVPDAGAAVDVARRLQAALRAPIALRGKEVVVGMSIGIVVHAVGKADADELLRNADMAMYAAKGQGKGRYVVFEPTMYTAMLRALQLKADLQQALARHEFFLHYQPTIDLETSQITGVEALLRWQHPERGVVAPAEFIPLAEETGLIVPLGWWVLTTACHQVRQWQVQYPSHPPLVLHINLAARQFQDPTLVAEVERVLSETGLAPHHLTLEITETTLMEDTDTTMRALQQLKALGIRIALDDFGMGYSSLSYLQRFPIDTLKIDKAFVAGLADGHQDAALARTIIGMGQTLHLETVAEGIETAGQLARLRQLGCQVGQGYYFARPLDPLNFGALLSQATLDQDGVAERQPA